MLNKALNFLKKYYLVLLFLIVIFLTYRVWIIPSGNLTFGDWTFHFSEQLKEFFGVPQIWQSSYGSGAINLIPAFDAFQFLYAVLSNFVQYDISSRVIYFWPVIIFGPLFSAYFLSKIFKSKFAILAGICVYIFNTYFLLLGTGGQTLMAAYTFLPIIFYFFKITLEKRHLREAMITALLLFFSTLYEPRITYIIIWILFLFFLYYVFIINNVFSKKNLFIISLFGLIPIVLGFLLCSFWITPLANVGALTTNSLFSRPLFGNEFLNILYSITLSHPFWSGSKPTVFVVQSIPLSFWLIPVFAFLGLWLNRKNKLIVFFGVISVFGIFLTKQAGAPFSGAYLWLYNHMPGFNAFREASKFYIIIAFGYSVLVASFIEWVFKNWTRGRVIVYGKYFITILIVIIFIINTKPFITGDIGTLFKPHNVPDDYIKVKSFILSNGDFSRGIWIPRSSSWTIFTTKHPQISFADAISLDWQNLSSKINKYDSEFGGKSFMNFIKQKDVHNLFNNSSIEYLFIPLEDKASDDDFFLNYGEPRQYYINELNKIEYLHRIDIGTKDVVVYKNQNYKPHIYLTNENETIYKNVQVINPNISYQFVNTTEYKITLRNISKPVYLNFSESYHPDWRIRISSFDWWKVLTDKNYFVSDKYHLQSDATLNAYLIDPKSICRQFICKQNKDGSYDISGTLYFAPQSYMYLGLIISGSTLILVLCFLSFTFGKHIYERKNK